MTLTLSYQVWDVHQLLAHWIAEQDGLYRGADVDVRLVDGSGTEWGEMEKNVPLTVGVGGVAPRAVSGGTPWRIVCVSTQYPLYWLISQKSVESIPHLRGARVAGRPLGHPPTTFARIIFRKHGLDLLQDCSYIPQPRPVANQPLIEMLVNGQADAIVVTSPPFALERAGFRLLAFFGAEVQGSTTGIAVNQKLLAPDAPEVQRLVEAHRRSLALLHADKGLALGAIQAIEPEIVREDAELLYERYVQPYWTRDGQPDMRIAETSLRQIAQVLNANRLTALSEVYWTS